MNGVFSGSDVKSKVHKNILIETVDRAHCTGYKVSTVL